MAQGLQGLWVSLAYTRAFGTLGLQFKSGRAHFNYPSFSNISSSNWAEKVKLHVTPDSLGRKKKPHYIEIQAD